MKNNEKPAVGRIIFILLVFSFSSNPSFGQDVSVGERNALISLYTNTAGPSWTNHTNWNTANLVSTWYGVKVESGKVVELDLRGNNLSGTLPAAFFNLPNLRKLHLRDNLLRGPIPSAVGNLTSLTVLAINENQLEGSLPSELGQLTNLVDVWIQDNQFSGAVPNTITNLTGLKNLALLGNQFSELPDLSALSLLEKLYVRENNFDFGDLLPNKNVPSSLFSYAPQGELGPPASYTVVAGGTQVLAFAVGGTGNTYQWYKGGTAISGANSASYSITNASSSHAGAYTCKARNPGLPDLTLTSQIYTVTVVNYTLSSTLDGVTNSTSTVTSDVIFGEVVSEKGIVYGSASGPDLDPADGDVKVSAGAGNGSFTHTISGLISGTTLYVRAFAVVGGFTYYGNEIVFTTPTKDYEVLAAIYAATDGANWTNNTNWLQNNDLSTWYGVTVDALTKRVVSLDLSNNGLHGLMPNLIEMDGLLNLDVSRNSFTFNDLMALLAPSPYLINFDYAPQADIGDGDSYEFSQGIAASITEPAALLDPSFIATWQKYHPLSPNPGGFDDIFSPGGYNWFYGPGFPPQLVAPATTEENEGTFRMAFRCASFPDLIIYSVPVTVDVITDRDILEAFFAHNGGENWIRSNAWNSSLPLSSWEGVFLDGEGYVQMLSLPNNNITGTLFSGLSQLSRLEFLYLSGNAIGGTLPSEWSQLANLEVLDLSENQIGGSFPSGFSVLNKLQYLDLSNNSFSGDWSNMSGLTHLISVLLRGNDIAGIPNFGALLDGRFGFVDLANNKLEFDDLQKISPSIIGGGVEYWPQQEVNEPYTINGYPGSQYKLRMETGGTQLLYQWYRDGNLLAESDPEYSNVQTSELTINSLATPGNYYCQVTNLKWGLLILKRANITVTLGGVDPASVPWYITSKTVSGAIRNAIEIPAFAESGLTAIKVYSGNPVTDVFNDLVGTVALTGSLSGYSLTHLASSPGKQAYAYKIALTDNSTPGTESPKSAYQQSVHLSINLGLNNTRNLIWTPYEGPGIVVYEYEVKAGNNMDISTWTSLATLSGNVTSYTDNGSYKYYVVVANLVAPPEPLKNAGMFQSLSNIFDSSDGSVTSSVQQLLIYPNPVSDRVVIDFDNPENQPVRIRVTDLSGRLWISLDKITSVSEKLEVSNLPPGVYIVQIIGQSVLTGRMIVN